MRRPVAVSRCGGGGASRSLSAPRPLWAPRFSWEKRLRVFQPLCSLTWKTSRTRALLPGLLTRKRTCPVAVLVTLYCDNEPPCPERPRGPRHRCACGLGSPCSWGPLAPLLLGSDCRWQVPPASDLLEAQKVETQAG